MEPASRPTARWIDPIPVTPPPALLDLTGGRRLLAETLARRGYPDAARAQAFLDPACYVPASPVELPDLPSAVMRLERAIAKGETIGVWGDFDVDGQTSTTLLVSVLRGLGARVIYHIPVRARESHGVNLPGLKEFIDRGAQVVLTCDTGITAHEAAAYARSRGVDFLISDHHGLPPELPEALAVVNPQRLSENHPLGTLSGVGTAYLLAAELAGRAGRRELADAQLDLVALGTVADLAILVDDARYLVQRGLPLLRNSPRLGIQSMLQASGTDALNLSKMHISFNLAPRLNAIGRLDDANPVVEFLTTNDLPAARVFAERLESLNANRKLLTDQVFKAALAQIETDPDLLDLPALVLAHPLWPAGVVGIVASRLVELYHKPTVLLTTPPGELARGSARSIEGVHITAAIAACQDLLAGFGGHPMAAGLSLEAEHIAAFRRALGRAVAEQTAGLELAPEIPIDAYLDLADISLELVEELDCLAPFGPGNPAPLLAVRDVSLQSVSTLDRRGEHLRLLVEDASGHVQPIIWWQGADSPLPEGRFDLAFRLRDSNYRGQREVNVELAAFRPSQSTAVEIAPETSVQIIDLRRASDPQEALAALAADGPVTVWREGEAANRISGCDRLSLAPAPGLAIYSIPPCQEILHQAIETVHPARIVLLADRASSDQPPVFLTRLVGLLNYALNQRDGRASLAALACATGQREITVLKGLDYLAARGKIVYLWEGRELAFVRGGEPDLENQDRLERDLKKLLAETAAYRAFYLRAAADAILDWIK